jgi:hypothetical protein
VEDVYSRIADAAARIAGFGGTGAVVGAVAATIRRELAPDSEPAFGEWAAYSAGLAGLFSLAFEVFRAI